jgi:hypothetical protein
MGALPESWQEFSAGKILLEELTFARTYKALLQRKLQEVNFNDLVAGPVEAHNRTRTGRQVTAKHVWRAVRRMGLFIPKAGDLLWQMLHQRVITGTGLHKIEKRKQYCPIHRMELTVQHISLSPEQSWRKLRGSGKLWGCWS